MSQRSLSLSFVSNTCFFTLFQLDVYFYLLFQILESQFPSLHCCFPVYFFFISLCIAFTSSSILHLYSVISVSTLITSGLNSAFDRLAISSLSSFSGVFDVFFHLGHISLSQCSCYIVRGRALSIHQGRTIHLAVLWCCMWGRAQKGNSAAY